MFEFHVEATIFHHITNHFVDYNDNSYKIDIVAADIFENRVIKQTIQLNSVVIIGGTNLTFEITNFSFSF